VITLILYIVFVMNYKFLKTILGGCAFTLACFSPARAFSELIEMNLNNVALMKNMENDPCMFVNNAIQASYEPELWGSMSSSQRKDLKKYAKECGFRF